MSYRVKTVASLTGIPRATLVAWERRYNLLEPRRSPAGYRIYTDEDVALLRQLKELVEGGMAISEAISQIIPAPPAPPPAPAAPAAQPSAAPGWWAKLLDHLLQFDRAQAERLMPRVEQLSFERALDEVYMPILQELGNRWERGEITVAQEHFASAFCGERMMVMFHQLGAGPRGGPTAACATLPDEEHSLGLLAIAIRLAMRGFDVTWLGPNIPIGDLCSFLSRHPPRLLCLSAMRTSPPEQTLDQVRQIRACARPETIVTLGGPQAHAFAGRNSANLWYCGSFSHMMDLWEHANAPAVVRGGNLPS